jgi:ABC-2 type transport system permease protein
MNIEVNALQSRPEPRLIVDKTPTQTLYWSIRRELWENRSIYIAPLIAAGVMLFGFVLSTLGLPHRRRALLLLDPAQQRAHIERPYDMLAMALFVTAFIVAVFYCLDALHGERRDRSILFWKSLPVSDFTAVLSKASIPLVVLPLLVFAIVVIAQVDMMLLSSAILMANDVPPATPDQLPLFENWVTLLYGLIATALWHSPIYGWLLLVSAWARRATFLWAVFPLLAVSALERMALGTTRFMAMLQYRMVGAMSEAFVSPPQRGSHGLLTHLTQINPAKFLSRPGLWVGLAFGAAFLVAAVRLRRYREPI